jgi:hypothetical protein
MIIYLITYFNPSLQKKTPPFFSPFLEGKRSRKRERKEKKPFSSLFLEGERKWIS